MASRRAALTPAEFTSVVMRPNRPSAVSTIRPQLPSFVTSTRRETRLSPALPICSAVSCAPSPFGVGAQDAGALDGHAKGGGPSDAGARARDDDDLVLHSHGADCGPTARAPSTSLPGERRSLRSRRDPGQRLRPYGQRGDLDAERLHGVGHGIGDGGGRADGAAFAHALVPPGVRGEGVSRWPRVNDGRSPAAGSG